MPWTETETVAAHIFKESEDGDILENPDLKQLFQLYKQWLNDGLEPNMKNFLYNEDPIISKTAVSLNDIRYELSTRWKEAPYEVKVPSREERYREELQSVLIYLKLRKIKSMMDQNQRDMEQPHSPEELTTFLLTHKHLKDLEIELTRDLGTVIYK